MTHPRTSQLPPLLRRATHSILFLLAFSACRATPPPPSLVLETPLFGAADAPVELLAFVDFECPFSRQQAPILRELAARYPTQLLIRVLFLPLDVHPHSVLAARAAVAAAQQNAFALFWQAWLRPDATLSREALIAWAVEAGLDAKRFAVALDGAPSLERVARDVAIGHALGVTGTPSLLLNGTLLQGLQPLDKLTVAVEHELAEAAILRTAGAQTAKIAHARVAQNAPKWLADYEKFIERGLPAPPQPVPLATLQVRASGVADVQLQPAALDTAFGGQRALLPPGQPTPSDAVVWRVSVRAGDPQLGKPDAPVTAVLFLDLFAQEAAAILPWLLQLPVRQADQVRLVIKHLPRPVHPLAQLVAEALEAAREQNRFLPLLNKLVEARQPLNQAAILAAATQVGLDANRFNTSLAAHGGKPRIDADVAQAAALGVTGFAALYLNGVPVPQLTQDAVLAALTAQGQKAAVKLREGVPAAQLYDALTAHGKLLEALAADVQTFDLSHAGVQGLPGAAVTVVVFGDFQCPFTARVWPHLRKLDEEMPGRLKIAWLDFPQTTAHPLAQRLAEAGQEARAQGKFWSFVAALARRVDMLDDRGLEQAARDAGLKDRPLQQALAQHKWTAAVQAERAQGERAGGRATPTVFLEGHLFQPTNGISADTLRPAIRQLLGTH